MATTEQRIKITADNRTKAAFKRVQGDLKKTQTATQKLAKATAALATAYVAFRAVSKVVNIWKDFSTAMSDLSAITGAVGKDLEFLKRKSLEFGASTTLTASQAAEAFKLIASAKPDLLQSGDALAAVTEQAIILAEASGSTLPEAAETLTLALNQTGAAASEANRFINVLAAGSKFGSSTIANSSEAIAKAGLVAGNAGTGFEEMNAAIQVLAKNTIFGSEAGTDLRNIYLNLAKQTNSDFKPALVGFTQAMTNLREAGLSDVEMLDIFGKRNITAATAMIRNVDLLEELRGKMTGTAVATEQAAIRVNNLAGDLKRLASAWEDVALFSGERADGALREATQTLTRLAKVAKSTILVLESLASTWDFAMDVLAAGATLDFDAITKLTEERAKYQQGLSKEFALIWNINGAQDALNKKTKEGMDTSNIVVLEEQIAKEAALKAAARTVEFQKAAAAEELALNDKYATQLFKLEESILAEDERLALVRENREFMVEDAFQVGLINDERRNELLLQLKQEFEDKKTAIEDKAVAERHKTQQRMLGAAAGIFGSLSSLMSKSGKEQTSASRAMARISIGISTAQAVMNALAVPPYPLGIALAAGAALKGVEAMRNVGGGGGGISAPTGTPTNTSPIAPPPNADGFGPEQSTSNVVNVTLEGFGYSPEGVRDLIEEINVQVGDGAEIRIAQA